jgi:hypothetical protein
VSAKDLKKFTAAAAMSKKEIEEFLSTPKVARIATIHDGKPHGTLQRFLLLSNEKRSNSIIDHI